MGFEIVPESSSCRLRVFIDYDLPQMAPARWLGLIFADVYARWCTDRMAKDAAAYFGKTGAQTVASTS
ncbi:hypothetical protein [Mesorhizobium sp.]|uniref:hypothetical protein n=1 Tax=Mesorhizobium sp. TaxID=1871066 RepID=UPI0025E0234C|nr:hypothetical protein [Mesorhizobium sp.]